MKGARVRFIINYNHKRNDIFTNVNMKITVVWDVTYCSLP